MLFQLIFRNHSSVAMESVVIEKLKHEYTPGGMISFDKSHQSELYCGKGWGSQEKYFRWTTAVDAFFTVKIPRTEVWDYCLRILAEPYLPARIENRTVRVIVNSHEVACWKMNERKWYKAQLSREVIGDDGQLNVTFRIVEPLRPSDYSHSKDDRTLGFRCMKILLKR